MKTDDRVMQMRQERLREKRYSTPTWKLARDLDTLARDLSKVALENRLDMMLYVRTIRLAIDAWELAIDACQESGDQEGVRLAATCQSEQIDMLNEVF